MKRLHVIAVCLIQLISISAPAGLDTETGESRSWDQDGFSLIVARIAKVTKLAYDRHSTDIAVLEPIATLAGHLDPTEKPTLEVGVWVDHETSSVKKMPHEGSVVLAVVYFDSSHKMMRVLSSVCTFMPERSALIQIDGLGDKRVAETIAAVRAARATAITAPASQPSK